MFSVCNNHDEEMLTATHKKRKMMFDEALSNIADKGRENINLYNKNVSWNTESTPLFLPGRRFLTLHKCDSIFHTEEWLPNGSSLFLPLTEDIMINTRNIEQFSTSPGQFFVADNNGDYSKTLAGQVLHLWRFCLEQRKLFISRSFLFQNFQEFEEVQQALQQL